MSALRAPAQTLKTKFWATAHIARIFGKILEMTTIPSGRRVSRSHRASWAASGGRLPDQAIAAVRGAKDSVDELALDLLYELDEGELVPSSGSMSGGRLHIALQDSISALLDALISDRPMDLEPIVSVARLKAELGVPLDVLMQSSVVVGRVVWDALVTQATIADAVFVLPALSSRLWLGIDRCTDVISESYSSFVDAGRGRSRLARDAALSTLLDGGCGSEFHAGQLLRVIGLPAGWRYVVLYGGRTESEATSLTTLDRQLRGRGIAAAAAEVRGEWFCLASVRAPHELAAVTKMAAQLSLDRLGVSTPCERVTTLATAKDEAIAAERCIPQGTVGVHVHGSSPLALLLTASPSEAQRYASSILGGLADLRSADQSLLLDTLRAWFQAKGSTAGAARILQCHRNTVLYRISRLGEVIGRSLSDPEDASELLLALRAVELCSGLDG